MNSIYYTFLDFGTISMCDYISHCGGCKTTALHSIIEKKVNKNSENIKRNTVI